MDQQKVCLEVEKDICFNKNRAMLGNEVFQSFLGVIDSD